MRTVQEIDAEYDKVDAERFKVQCWPQRRLSEEVRRSLALEPLERRLADLVFEMRMRLSADSDKAESEAP